METMVTVFSHKKILITGGTGFVGAHLVEYLLAQKANVYATALQDDPFSYFSLSGFSKKVTRVFLNIQDYDAVHACITKNRIEYIFHLAAQPFVDIAVVNPRETLATNIMGTVNILESSRHNPHLKALVIASSDKAYGTSTSGIYRETDALVGRGIYEVSKSCTDLLGQAYYHTYHMPVTIARFGNIYGEGDQDSSRLIPGLLDACIRDQTLVIRSDGTPTRDYLYVKDVVAGYALLASHIKKTQGESYNFGSPDSFSVLDIIRTAEQVLGKKIDYRIENIARLEIQHQHLDYQKVVKQLGWTPVMKLSRALPLLYEWYKKQSR